MIEEQKPDDIIKRIVSYASNHSSQLYEISFPEGDAYLCLFDNGEYADNGELSTSPLYEEWYEADFEVTETIENGPNKDPRYDFIIISRHRMPKKVTSNGLILYQD